MKPALEITEGKKGYRWMKLDQVANYAEEKDGKHIPTSRGMKRSILSSLKIHV